MSKRRRPDEEGPTRVIRPRIQDNRKHDRDWQADEQRAAKRLRMAIERERKSCEQQLAALEEQCTRHMWSKVHEVDALKKQIREYETMIHALTNRMGQLSDTIRMLENQLYAAQIRLRV